jgi:Zn-dependent M28 family amino/carboxypeptidase
MKYLIPIIAFLLPLNLFCQSNPIWNEITGSAYFDNHGYDVLERLCYETGGRLPGSDANQKAIDILIEELAKIGLEAKRESFEMPGWRRGNDKVEMLSPVKKELRATALGYTQKCPLIETTLVFAQHGYSEDYDLISAKGKIVVVNQGGAPGKPRLLRYQAIENAALNGAKALLIINTKEGGLVQCGVSNFHGHPAAVPAFSITKEEGAWLKALLKKNIEIKMKIQVESECFAHSADNVVVTIPGKNPQKVVVGAHSDSWDLGNGAVDNGQGTAVLFDLARILANHTKDNYYTIELVWFNAEELGLWGSRAYVDKHKNEEILAMINMDMTGSPTGVNLMGFKEFDGWFSDLCTAMSGFDMKKGVTDNPWTNSDHMYFMFEGIPSFTFHGHLDKNMYHYYHDFGDTFEKVSKRYISDAAAIISIFTYELANAKDFDYHRRSQEEVKELLIEYKLDERLKTQGQWKFGE